MVTMPQEALGSDKSEAARQLVKQVARECNETLERIRGIERQVTFARRYINGPYNGGDHIRSPALDNLAVAERALGDVLLMAGRFLDAQVIGLRGARVVSDEIDEASRENGTPPSSIFG